MCGEACEWIRRPPRLPLTGVLMARVIVYDRCILAAREVCLRLRRRHQLDATPVHPTDFDLTFDDGPAPSLIVTELQMPIFSGFELIRQVRSVYRSADVPIVAYTAIDEALAWEKARAIGADAVIFRNSQDAMLRLDVAIAELLGEPVPTRPARAHGRLWRFFLPAQATPAAA